MLVLGSSEEGFADDSDPELRYRLPVALQPVVGPDRVPQVSLSRRSDGRGLFRLRLAVQWPSLGAKERPVPLSRGRFRLRWRSPAAEATGQWHEALIGSDAVIDSTVPLSATEAAIAARLLPGGTELVEVEAEFWVAGRHPTFPWMAKAAAAPLRDRVVALLEDGASEWSDVEDAFTGLPMSDFEWIPLKPGALPPPPDEAMRALARHSASVLLLHDGSTWAAAPTVPEWLSVSLAVARAGTHRFSLRWSFTDFLAAQSDPEVHLQTLNEPAPFEAATLQLVNDVILDEEAVRSITVEIKTGGPSGRLQHVFRSGEPSATRLSFVREGHEPLKIEWRPTAIVKHGGRPTTVRGRFRPGDLAIRVASEHLGVTGLLMQALPSVFDYVEAIEIVLTRRTLRLTGAEPQAWIVAGATAPEALAVRAVLDDGTTAEIGELPLGARGLTVGPVDLGVGDAAEVVLSPPDDLEQRAAYLAVQVQDGPWRTLEAGNTLHWAVRRPTRLHAPRTQYRTRHVPLDSDGKTSAITESVWREAVGETATVEI